MAGMIEQYARSEAGLDFDPSLARRMTAESEAHLWQPEGPIPRRYVLPLVLYQAVLAASGGRPKPTGTDGSSVVRRVLLAEAGEFALIGLVLFHVVGPGSNLKRPAMLQRPE
jgi:hypothetical protein